MERETCSRVYEQSRITASAARLRLRQSDQSEAIRLCVLCELGREQPWELRALALWGRSPPSTMGAMTIAAHAAPTPSTTVLRADTPSVRKRRHCWWSNGRRHCAYDMARATRVMDIPTITAPAHVVGGVRWTAKTAVAAADVEVTQAAGSARKQARASQPVLVGRRLLLRVSAPRTPRRWQRLLHWRCRPGWTSASRAEVAIFFMIILHLFLLRPPCGFAMKVGTAASPYCDGV